MHFATAMFFTVALALEAQWDKPFHEINELWTVGALLVGLAALPAGRLGDWWSARGMMVICLLGMGLSLIACSQASGDMAMIMALASLGLFAAIYHPIGIPWLIANGGEKTGRLLAVNGVFGGLGPAAAAVATGFIVDFAGWRWAFALPGIVVCVTGLAMLWCTVSGRLPSTGLAPQNHKSQPRSDAYKAFAILLLTMFLAGVIYNSTQAAMPKYFAERIGDFVGGEVARAGTLVGIVYTISALMQVLGGALADRYPLKAVYMLGWCAQIAFMTLMASLSGFGVFFAAILVASASTSILPAENMLLFRFAPEKHKGLAFGVKFVLAFGAAPIGIHVISFVKEATGAYYGLFLGLAVVSVLAFVATWVLPSDKSAAQAAAPAE